MLRGDAERMIRRAMEENEAEFSDEQIEALSTAILNIANRVVEEALASWRPSGGGKPSFFG